MTASTGPRIPNQLFFTPLEIADLLRVDRKTVQRWLKNPEHPLNGQKLNNMLWRVPRENLVIFLEKEYGT